MADSPLILNEFLKRKRIRQQAMGLDTQKPVIRREPIQSDIPGEIAWRLMMEFGPSIRHRAMYRRLINEVSEHLQ